MKKITTNIRIGSSLDDDVSVKVTCPGQRSALHICLSLSRAIESRRDGERAIFADHRPLSHHREVTMSCEITTSREEPPPSVDCHRPSFPRNTGRLPDVNEMIRDLSSDWPTVDAIKDFRVGLISKD